MNPEQSRSQSVHQGMHYLQFLQLLAERLSPRSYFEIGTSTGSSARTMTCPTVCVDPSFQISEDIIGRKESLHCFQMPSDRFFRTRSVRQLLQGSLDLAFLDGMHLFEYLLRDFANTEAQCHERSIILLHDCLPTNHRMALRVHETGLAEEVTRHEWTGDVWKIIPALKQLRPDLRMFALDCPPTGLVACTNLDPGSTVIQQRYYSMLDSVGQLDLAEFGMHRLWNELPVIDTGRLAANPDELTLLFDMNEPRSPGRGRMDRKSPEGTS